MPDIEADAFLAADVLSGTILVEGGETGALPIASITKLMTALVAAEYINLDKDVTVTESAMASTSVVRLTPGIQLSSYSLLLPLLLESSNTAAQMFANQLGEDLFVKRMNQKAASLGMDSTNFSDASGAHSGNVASAQDLLRLATYIYNNRSFVYQISSGAVVDTAYDVYPFGKLSNFNATPGLTGLVGGKVGQTTAARETALVLYKINIQGEERVIAFVVLGSDDRYTAVQKLHTYVTEQYGG